MIFKPFFIFKRIVNLRIRHRTGFKPAVKHIANAAHHSLAAFIVRIRIYYIVNIRLVQIIYLNTGCGFNFGHRTKYIYARKIRII